MPQPTPGHGQIRPDGPKRPDIGPSPVDEPSHSGDLAARLDVLAGGSLASMVPTEDLILDFNQIFTNATHQRFEHRTMLGLAINAMRPAHGKITEFHERIAERLGRGTRWVQDTVSVAESIGLAIDQGVALPLEIREIYWRKVPTAVDNVRNGRSLDFTPKKEMVIPTPEERTQAVAQALQALTEALEDIQSPTQRSTLATQAITALEPYTDVVADPDPEPPAPSPDPEPPSPRRPGRRPGRRRR